MPAVVVIPVKSFRDGYTRMAESIGQESRTKLGRAVAEHVAGLAAAADSIPLIVTRDADVAAWATSAGFPSLPDPGQGLNEAAGAGVEWASAARSSWIVLHADLPLLNARDLHVLLSFDGDVIAPSADGGTSAISSVEPFAFRYGPGSFHSHLPHLDDPEVVVRSGLLHDIDSTSDLEAALEHPRGAWLAEHLE